MTVKKRATILAAVLMQYCLPATSGQQVLININAARFLWEAVDSEYVHSHLYRLRSFPTMLEHLFICP